MSDLDVLGGLGGLEVAVEDLRRAALGLVRCAAVLEEGLGTDWDVGPWLLVGTAPGAAVQVAQAREESAALRRAVGGAVTRLRDLARSTSSAADRYEAAEDRNRRLVAVLHRHAVVTARVVTAVTGQAFGVLDEGSGWDVEVTSVAPATGVPPPRSAETLLAGISSLGHDGSVRVVEVPVADGTTTWVVQVPGTHSPVVTEGGEVPMDWPANVSLMLRATSASKVAAVKALARAQGGRAGPGDRVVVAGHSQGGLVAAALASDPEFTRRHRVSHVVTAGSPIDQFPVPSSTEVLSIQHATDPVHALDVSPPPDRRSWTTVVAAPAFGVASHELSAYRSTASRADRSDDVSLRRWRAGLSPVLTPAPGATPVVHEFRSRRRWQNRDS